MTDAAVAVGRRTPATFTWRAGRRHRCRPCSTARGPCGCAGTGLALRLADAAGGLTPFTGTYLFTDPVDGSAVFTSYETGRRYRVTSLAGSLEVARARGARRRGRGRSCSATATPRGRPRSRRSTRPPTRSCRRGTFDDAVAAVTRRSARTSTGSRPGAPTQTPAAALAAYVLWSATVAPEGLATRESVLMSMHWMDKLWSWDHCFNALALAHGETDAAVDQFLAPFDHQDATGALPDSITHSEVLYNYVKPPIHGWALRGLRARADRPLTTAELTEIHGRLARWTGFWLDHRRVPGHPLPYYQHGNDSGWDNSTTFDLDRVIESPDLAGFLALQLEVLADLSDELGLPADALAHRLRRAPRRAARATCGTARSSSRSAPCPGRRAPRRACSTSCRSSWASGCPPTSATRSPPGSRGT